MGAGARELVAATLADDARCELPAAARRVDDVLAGASPATRSALRPLLVAPLERVFLLAVPAAESELNRLWQAQVLQPFERGLAARYPFDTSSRVEAGVDEIARVFGPAGAISRFSDEALGPLVRRDGDAVAPRRWGDAGLRLRPELVRGLAIWTAAAEAASGAGGAAGHASTAFQLLPLAAPGLVEYAVAIDGQTLRYRNGAASWSDFVWPGGIGQPGVRISGRGVDGREIVLVDAPGAFGLDRAFELAERRRLADGSSELAWHADGQTVRLRLRVVRAAGSSAGVGTTRLRGLRLPSRIVGVEDTPGARATTFAQTAGSAR
ncbi:MAG: hypothetical protein MZW92_50480 [Comamonadaceae bacterium]|nr:hypothetical protein [Comamonadaceae bacterium]